MLEENGTRARSTSHARVILASAPRAPLRCLRLLCLISMVFLIAVEGRAQAPSGAHSAGPPPAPASSAGDAKAPPADVKVQDTVIFTVFRAHGGRTAAARARAASEALKQAIVASGTDDVKTERQGPATVVFAGTIPIIDLYDEDAAADEAASAEVYGKTIAARVQAAVRSEKRRSAIAGTVFSSSLVVFFGLIALYVVRKVGEFETTARDWALQNPDRIPAIRLQSLEVVGPAAIRGGIIAGLLVGRWLAQLGLAYAWLVFALSLFNATRPFVARLTGFVVTPLSDLAGRIAASLPLALVALVSGIAVYLLLRFTQLFFASVARGESKLEWLPADLALPTSLLLRTGIVVATLVFVSPVVTGDAEGALARSGSILMLALGVSSSPLLACGVIGIVAVFGRRLRVGHHAEVGGRSGRILEVGLLEVRLVDEAGCEVRVPHLLTLVHPTRALGERLRVGVELCVDAAAPPVVVKPLLHEAAGTLGRHPHVELADIDAKAARYSVSTELEHGKTAGDLRMILAQALSLADIALARSSRGTGE